MLTIRCDPAPTRRLLDEETRQLPYAAAKALNTVATKARDAERAHVANKFKIRRPWVLRQIFISPYATKAKPRVVIQVAPAADFLDWFEEGGQRVAYRGNWRWVPNKDVFKGRIVMRTDPLHPANLRFKRVGHSLRGDHRTFMVNLGNARLVLQRVSRSAPGASQRITQGPRAKTRRARPGGTRLLYRLVRKTRTPATLQFIHTTLTAAQQAWPDAIATELSNAMATRK